MRICRVVFALLVFSVATVVRAGEAWVVQGFGGDTPSDACNFILWVGTTFAWNSASTPSDVTILGFSNMDLVPPENVLTIPPNHVVDFRDGFDAWSAGAFGGPVWIEHLSYPEDRVQLSASVELWENNGCYDGGGSGPLPARGRITMPVATSLVPAGKAQRHFPVDSGVIRGTGTHFNVGVYNGGLTAGSGRVEVRAACDDTLLVGMDVTLPANGFQQYSLPEPETGGQCVGLTNSPWLLYASVVFDQPSLSYVSTIREGLPITISDVIVGP